MSLIHWWGMSQEVGKVATLSHRLDKVFSESLGMFQNAQKMTGPRAWRYDPTA